ncbi:OmpP1/FadL family transporter [Agrobacterium vitis]|uniref:Long-chain fatty acid transporter n=1 Tax=Agrobacterium vitis TaxID=373 RepID=A0A7K1R954_AGRVI|nr:outer membrane protein transport protein [Agrobacterium vitis]MVA54648.1 long-chain fatty acid transporter [Agrobacterium vitis]
MNRHYFWQAPQFALAICVSAISFAPCVAVAGGFSRGEADTDILFTDGNYSLRSGAIYVSPSRSFSTLNGARASDKAYSDEFWIPSVAVKATLGSGIACALTYTQPFGASATYGSQAQNAEFTTAVSQGLPLVNPTSKMQFSTDEYGATCDARVDAGPGRFYVIGGVFLESFEYKENTLYGNIRLKDDGALGYRVGAAYDIPEYAMRFQLMYRSQVSHDAEGTFTPSALAAAAGVTDTAPADGTGTLPQSIKLSAQTGVAPGWLVYGSLTWTDWSVLQNFRYDVTELGTSNKTFNYKDGYTVQIGVGHEFTEKLSGTINVTWDEGVGTGADITTDTWSLGLGAEYKTKFGKFDLGTSVSYLTAGSQSVSAGATYDATAKHDWAVAVGLGYLIEF